MKVLMFPILLLSIIDLFSQKDFNIWHLGLRKGLSIDFNVEPANVTTSTFIKMAESGASICDPETGEIILYCNDNTIWNSQNLVITDGTGLEGSNSTAQGSLIVSHPCGCNKYIVFQNDIGEFPFTIEDYGLSYSVVDMMLENGLGRVIEKNIFISNKIAEPMIAVKDTANGYWLICHEIESYDYIIYHIGNEGLKMNFQRYSTNNFVDNAGQGTLCATFDGKKLAMGQRGSPNTPFIEILDFNISTGKLRSDTTIFFDSSDSDYQGAISVVFSPNGKILYAVDYGHLYQFDFTDKNEFKRSIIYRRDTSAALAAFYFLQLAPNGKIYVSLQDTIRKSDYLGVIEFPNEAFPKCNFKPFEIEIPQNSFAFGFPAIIKNVYSSEYKAFNFDVDFTIEFLDSNKVLLINKSYNVKTNEWNLGDGKISNELNITHIYKDTGEYIIRLTVTNKFGCKKTIEKVLRINFITTFPTLNVYPNPTNDIVKIESSRAIVNIKLHSVSGQYIFEKKDLNSEFFELDLNNIESQLYILTIESNGNIFRKKILKIE